MMKVQNMKERCMKLQKRDGEKISLVNLKIKNLEFI